MAFSLETSSCQKYIPINTSSATILWPAVLHRRPHWDRRGVGLERAHVLAVPTGMKERVRAGARQRPVRLAPDLVNEIRRPGIRAGESRDEAGVSHSDQN